MIIKNLFDEYLSVIIKNRNLSKEDFKEVLFKDGGQFHWKIEQYQNQINIIMNKNKEYLDILKKYYKSLNKIILDVIAETKTRVLCDTSSPFMWLPDEVGLAWDPILDTPFIPSSEIKGAVSAVIEFEKGKILRDFLFGGEVAELEIHTKSLVDFTNAYPIGSSKGLLEKEVMTPIYAKVAKEDEASPTPVKFYVIKPGVKVRFLAVIDKIRFNELMEKMMKEDKKKLLGTYNISSIDNICNILREYIKKAFEIWGIGTKTSSGYGEFRIIDMECDI